MSRFRNLIVTGAGWTLSSSGLRAVWSLGVNVALAAMVAPEAFGLVVMASLVFDLVSTLGNVGISRGLIQLRELDPDDASTAFWSQLVLNTGLCVATSLSAPVAAQVFEKPLLRWFLPIMALRFLLSALGATPRSLLARQLEFKVLSKIDLASATLGGVCALVAAALGLGVWSLLIQLLVTQATLNLGVLALGRWRPRWVWRTSTAKRLFAFSGPLYLTELVNYFTRNADRWLIAHFIGSHSLGIYTRGQAFLTRPVESLVTPVRQVLFSGFSAIQDDHRRVKKVYLRAVGALSLIIFPVSLSATVLAGPAIRWVLGPRWAEMIVVIQIVAPAASLAAFRPYKELFKSQGRTDLGFRVGLIGQSTVLLSTLAGAPWGFLGIITGRVFGALISTFVQMHFAGTLISLRLSEVFSHVRGVILANVGMLVAMYFLGRTVGLRAQHEAVQLLALALLGAFVYASTLALFRPRPVQDLIALLRSRRYRKRANRRATEDDQTHPRPPGTEPPEPSEKRTPPQDG